MSETVHPVESTPGNAVPKTAVQASGRDIHNHTFMGNMSLSGRAGLFALIGAMALIASGFGLFRADRDLSAGRADLARAHQLAALVANVEADVWRIRAEGTADTAPLAGRLDELYRRDDTGPVRENISTLSEALAQYSQSLNTKTETTPKAPPDLTGLEVALRTAARDIETRIGETGVLSLKETIATMRAAELAFIEDGSSEPLPTIETQWWEFRQLLSAMPLAEDEKTSLLALMNIYQSRLTAYVRARLVRGEAAERGDEILSYMAPSIEEIANFTKQNVALAMTAQARLLDTYRTLIATGIVALVLVVMLAGTIFLRSVSAPVIAAAEAGRRLAAGNTDFTIIGLGNQNETGDIARAFSVLKERLAETNQLRDSLKSATTEAEQGRAASAEAAWLRRDLESMKAELDKGQAAIDEVELLRAVIEATKTDIARAHTQTAPEAKPEPAAEQAPATESIPLDSISMVSRRVAASSQTVTQAAIDAERTGILIRNLSAAIDGVDGIEALIASIGEQADMLIVDMPDGASDLMVLQGGPQGLRNSDAVTRRFDIIRKAAGKATWAIRDIATVILDARSAALDIARSSSAEALDVTTELLEQSENLRGMLDQLVLRMEVQLSPGQSPAKKDTPDITS